MTPRDVGHGAGAPARWDAAASPTPTAAALEDVAPEDGDAAAPEVVAAPDDVTAPEAAPAAPSRHGPIAQLLIAWSPLSVILLAYAAAQWVNEPLARGRGSATNRLGFALHVTDPAQADRDVFGAVPSVWLQRLLVDGSPHWWDPAAALVYSTHFVFIPVLTGVVWFRLRERFRAWLAAVLTFTTVGVGGYVAYPAAPPWLASDLGEIGAVRRTATYGWEFLHLDLVGGLTASGLAGSNPVAAMPSLHAGGALLVALFLWPLATARWRAVLVAYVLAMGVTLVYTGEHYVVDVVVGWATAAVATAAGAVVRRRGARGDGGRRGLAPHTSGCSADPSGGA